MVTSFLSICSFVIAISCQFVGCLSGDGPRVARREPCQLFHSPPLSPLMSHFICSHYSLYLLSQVVLEGLRVQSYVLRRSLLFDDSLILYRNYPFMAKYRFTSSWVSSASTSMFSPVFGRCALLHLLYVGRLLSFDSLPMSFLLDSIDIDSKRIVIVCRSVVVLQRACHGAVGTALLRVLTSSFPCISQVIFRLKKKDRRRRR